MSEKSMATVFFSVCFSRSWDGVSEETLRSIILTVESDTNFCISSFSLTVTIMSSKERARRPIFVLGLDVDPDGQVAGAETPDDLGQVDNGPYDPVGPAGI